LAIFGLIYDVILEAFPCADTGKFYSNGQKELQATGKESVGQTLQRIL